MKIKTFTKRTLIVQSYLILVRLFDLNVFEPIEVVHTKVEPISDTEFEEIATFEEAPENDVLFSGDDENIEDIEEKGVFGEDFRPHICEICDAAFTTNAEKLRHRREEHKNQQSYPCKICLHQCPTIKALLAHLKNSHDEKTYTCEVCSKSYKNERGLKRHKSYAHNRNIPCDHCEMKFRSPYYLNLHIKNVHEKGHFPCECCIPKRVFSSEHGLKQHIDRIERSKLEKNVLCDQCDLKFSRQSDLKLHYTKVHLVDPVTCEHCGLTYGNESKLRTHVKRVHTERPRVEWVCEICAKSFFTKNPAKTRQKHLLTHGESKYSCDYCDKKFRQRENWLGHVNEHKGIFEFKCETCNKVL